MVSITAGCFLYRAWEALLIGLLGALLCVLTMPLFDRLGVDDPVGASSVHGVCGIWVCFNFLHFFNKNSIYFFLFISFYYSFREL